jgi:hypothetical protein
VYCDYSTVWTNVVRVPIIFKENFLLYDPSSTIVTQSPVFSTYRWSFQRGTVCRMLKLLAHLQLAASQRMLGAILLPHFNHQVYFIIALTHSGLHHFQPVILEDFSSVPTVINHLSPRGNFMYLKFYTSAKYTYFITVYLCVSYDTHNKEKMFPHPAKASSL